MTLKTGRPLSSAKTGRARGQGVVAAVGKFVTEAAKLRAEGYHYSLAGQEAARLSALRRAGGAGGAGGLRREVRGGGRQGLVAEEAQAQEAHRDMENDLIFGADPAVPSRERARRPAAPPPRGGVGGGKRAGRAPGGGDYTAVKRQVAGLKAQAARLEGGDAAAEGSASSGRGGGAVGALEAQRSQTAQQLRSVDRRISRELARVEAQQRRPARADPLAAFRA